MFPVELGLALLAPVCSCLAFVRVSDMDWWDPLYCNQCWLYGAIIFNWNLAVFPMKLQPRCSTKNPSLFKRVGARQCQRV